MHHSAAVLKTRGGTRRPVRVEKRDLLGFILTAKKTAYLDNLYHIAED